MNPTNAGTWIGDWAWSLVTLVIHVCGLALIGERVVSVLSVSSRASITERTASRKLISNANIALCSNILAFFRHADEVLIRDRIGARLDSRP